MSTLLPSNRLSPAPTDKRSWQFWYDNWSSIDQCPLYVGPVYVGVNGITPYIAPNGVKYVESYGKKVLVRSI